MEWPNSFEWAPDRSPIDRDRDRRWYLGSRGGNQRELAQPKQRAACTGGSGFVIDAEHLRAKPPPKPGGMKPHQRLVKETSHDGLPAAGRRCARACRMIASSLETSDWRTVFPNSESL